VQISPQIVQICNAVRLANGRAWVVGGAVRDALMGIESKDIDIEVHGIGAELLARTLKKLGTVNEIGKSFGVFKLVLSGNEFDVSIPRRDSQQGPGHNDIEVVGDPHMGMREAGRRRDLTINAIAYDPLAEEYADPWNGMHDIKQGLLVAVDSNTFGEDPLRVLRVMQFAARFGFSLDPSLVDLCNAADLTALPAERLWGEFEKLLMRSSSPSVGWTLAHQLHILKRVLPEISDLQMESVNAALDRAAQYKAHVDGPGRATALMLSAMLHNAGSAVAEVTLERLGVFKLHGYQVRKRVIQSVSMWPTLADGTDDTTLRRLAEDHDISLVAGASWSVTENQNALNNLQRAQELGISTESLPGLLKGRDLRKFGIEPGPKMGEWLQKIRNEQLEGRVTDTEEAVLWLERQLP
jgi:tRNA nucleotidyltransferase (CCA-adding enzyme)